MVKMTKSVDGMGSYWATEANGVEWDGMEWDGMVLGFHVHGM